MQCCNQILSKKELSIKRILATISFREPEVVISLLLLKLLVVIPVVASPVTCVDTVDDIDKVPCNG